MGQKKGGNQEITVENKKEGNKETRVAGMGSKKLMDSVD